MKNAYYGYIRVSTLKQGAGVSLTEQKDAISRYALNQGLTIGEWLEEKETAAKQGRPLFLGMMKNLRHGKARGVIMHKIDRSARNLKDWSDLGSLIDCGIDVRFAHESLDLTVRGGRLSADIQAVIAADYIRNLREEAIKGIYGRLKQGIYPFRAPLGYLDTGAGNVKVKDPVKAPLVRKAFELYATQRYSLRDLVKETERLGLTNYNGRNLYLSNLSSLLSNPFYTGVLRVKGQHFKGGHEPLVPQKLFQTVQDLLDGKARKTIKKHQFLFRRRLICMCGRFLYGEVQKSHVYYRCQNSGCQTKGIRETTIFFNIKQKLSLVQLSPIESKLLDQCLDEMTSDSKKLVEEGLQVMRLQITSITQRLDQLTDAYLDGILDKESLQERRQRLLLELSTKEAAETELIDKKGQVFARIRKFLELAKSLVHSFESAAIDEKRRLVETVFSNFLVEEKKLTLSMHLPFSVLAFEEPVLFGALNRNTARLHRTEVDNAMLEEVAPRKAMSKSQMKEFLQYLVAHPELLPELPNEELSDDNLFNP